MILHAFLWLLRIGMNGNFFIQGSANNPFRLQAVCAEEKPLQLFYLIRSFPRVVFDEYLALAY